VPDRLRVRVRVLGKERFGGHDHARGAVATLDAMLFPECPLHGIEHSGWSDTLNGRDLPTIRLNGQNRATLYTFAVEMNGARPALACFAANMCSGQAQVIPEKLHEQRAWLYIRGARLTVDCNGDLHDSALPANSVFATKT